MTMTSTAPTSTASLELASYAAVKAALAEGFALDEVLALEEIDPAAWARSDGFWKKRLASERNDLARYSEALALAEDRLEREVTPLRDELGAWLAFLDAYAVGGFELMNRLGLSMNDLSRLQRTWRARVKADPAVGKAMLEARNKPIPPLPPIQVKPAVLRCSRGSAPAAGQPQGPAGKRRALASTAVRDARVLMAHRARKAGEGHEPDAPRHQQGLPVSAPPAPPPIALTGPLSPNLTLEQHASLSVELALAPERAAEILSRYGLTPSSKAVCDEAIRSRVAGDPKIGDAWNRAYAAYHAWVVKGLR